MSAAAPAVTEVADVSIAEQRANRAARIRGAAFAGLGLLAIQAAIGSFETAATFSFWVDRQGGTPFAVGTTVGILWLITGVVTGLAGILQLVRGTRVRWRPLLGIVIPLWVIAVLGALLDGRTANLTGVLAGSMAAAVPITLGAFAGLLSERSGMFNIAIEGKMLIGACVAAIVASVTQVPLLAVVVAALAAALVGLLLAWLGIRWGVNQIIAGVVINIGALGITNFIFLRILTRNTSLNTPATIEATPIPLLREIPVLGPILFNGSPYLYLTLGIMLFLTYMVFRTRWGLRLRAAGEKPSAAGTVGIDVLAIRYRAMIIAGILSGIAGSALVLASAGSFQMNMTSGRGFIALAAMIFGAWHPVYAFGAALVFGFSDSAQSLLSILGVDVPPQLLNSVPYLVTIIVVAGVVGRVRGPASAGMPYKQG